MTNKIMILIALVLCLISLLVLLIWYISEKRKIPREDEGYVIIESPSEEEIKNHYHRIFNRIIRKETIEFLKSSNEERQMELLLIIERKLKQENIDFNAVKKHFCTFSDTLY